MPSELPTIASCPHCRAILLYTPRGLVHPMNGDRERLRRALGGFWLDHSRVRFDGRFHRCQDLERVLAAGTRRTLAADRCALRVFAAMLGILIPWPARGQERSEPLPRGGMPGAS